MEKPSHSPITSENIYDQTERRVKKAKNESKLYEGRIGVRGLKKPLQEPEFFDLKLKQNVIISKYTPINESHHRNLINQQLSQSKYSIVERLRETILGKNRIEQSEGH